MTEQEDLAVSKYFLLFSGIRKLKKREPADLKTVQCHHDQIEIQLNIAVLPRRS